MSELARGNHSERCRYCSGFISTDSSNRYVCKKCGKGGLVWDT